jgi:oxaloacetate decarboxylase gamma subunit
MTIVEMLQQSAVLTMLGMAVVFAFLWLMIICVTWVGKVVHQLGLDKDVLPQEAPAQVAPGTRSTTPVVSQQPLAEIR